MTAQLVSVAADRVLTDVAVDGHAQLRYEQLHHPEADYGCLVYAGTVRPSPPYRLLEPREYTFLGFSDSRTSLSDAVYELASEIQTLVQLERWVTGLDPTWPPCPAHLGRHPLAPRFDGPAPVGVELSPFWACTAHETPADGGTVAQSAYAVEVGRWPGFGG